MSGGPYDPHYFDPAERELLTAEEELLVELFGEWVARREAGALVLLEDLLARAAEFGNQTKSKLEDLIVVYELHRYRPD
jgi:hypothetical protein